MSPEPQAPKDGNFPNPSRIMDLATGYWGSAALLAAVQLQVFDLMADGPQTADWLASCLGCNARALGTLLEALVSLGLLHRYASPSSSDPAQFGNTPDSASFLVNSSPAFIGSAILWSAGQYTAWGNLAATVKIGEPAVDPAQHLGDNESTTRTFVIGMNNRAKGVARGVVGFLDLKGCSKLLDVGGGCGAYSVLLAERNPGLMATVLDLPGIIDVTRDLVSRSPVASQILLRPGDATKDVYGWDEFDAVLFSGVLHQMKPDTIRTMLSNARTALRPGGRVIICDVMLEPDRTGPVFSALFSLQMLLTSAEGAVFSRAECAGWLTELGFENINTVVLPAPLPYTVITAFVP